MAISPVWVTGGTLGNFVNWVQLDDYRKWQSPATDDCFMVPMKSGRPAYDGRWDDNNCGAKGAFLCGPENSEQWALCCDVAIGIPYIGAWSKTNMG